MKKQIRLNAFDMNCVGHIQHGLWTHPRDRSTAYNTIEYWQHLARTAERGLFDGIFLADIVGVYDVYKGSPDPSLANAVQVPVNDPLLVVPIMAAATKHIGFGVTANLTYETPYLFARRMSTLDHLTGGRVGWNIVTGYLDSAARAMGFKAQREHDNRYDVADEFMEVVYKLWEGSWERDAVVQDRERRLYARPDKVHRVQHAGRHYNVDAIHLSEPSPQRTPVLYQAGASARGKDFAASHAECVFLYGPNKEQTRKAVEDVRPSWSVARGKRPKKSTRSITAMRAQKALWRTSRAQSGSTSRNRISMSRSSTRRRTRWRPCSRRSPATARRFGRCARSSTRVSAPATHLWSARPRRSPTNSSPGSRRPVLTASTSAVC
jgi:FMN-dependent oxidoreductase (nitrilotriacetate monooxygenase family)